MRSFLDVLINVASSATFTRHELKAESELLFMQQRHNRWLINMVSLRNLPSLVCITGALGLLSPKSLSSSITLLIDNDLQGIDNPAANSGVIVLEPRSFANASKSCEALGEELWRPGNYSASLRPNLDYLKYSGQAQNISRFWVASGRTIDIQGTSHAENTTREFPVLCTQTAPFSNTSFQDTSDRWHVTVGTNDEYITGFRDRLSFRFLGVRYAEQPRRFSYSTMRTGNESVVDATEYGEMCVQYGQGSEDCLFLNIFTPYLPLSSGNQGLKPVMFWIHGGAFTGGTGSDPTFDGGNQAARSDVVVRLCTESPSTTVSEALGFSRWTIGSRMDRSRNTQTYTFRRNYGLADQITALDWVRKNIRDFGGDPNRITVFGQSAGAASARALMASPKAAGKFAGAIPMSNLGGIQYGTAYSRYMTIEEEMESVGNDVLTSAGCANATSAVSCLRAVPASTLSLLSYTASSLVMDGTYLVSEELQLGGPTLPVHLLMGTCRDDGAALIGYPDTPNQSEFLESLGFEVWAGVLNNRFRSAHYYEFNRTYQLSDWPGLDVCQPPITVSHPFGDPSGEYFKCHSGELYLVFGNIARMGLPLRDEFDLRFEQFVVDTFGSFARTYDPNPDLEYLRARGYVSTIEEAERSGAWEAVSGKSKTTRVLQWPVYQAEFSESGQCDALELGLDYYLK
ncbi:cholinesterase [Xylariaceae sp. FL1019]|nr:cholinesterase [Xylariaceae sp. FL1019]